MSFTATPNAYQPPRLQASSPVDAFGPVPDTVLFPKLQAPSGARFCEEVNAFVPADLQYRIRGLRTEAPRKNKSFVRRIFKKQTKTDDIPLVMAMGLTHTKMNLIPLAQAQQDKTIRYHGVANENEDEEYPEVDEKMFKTELIPLWEAQTRPDIIYRGKNPLHAVIVSEDQVAPEFQPPFSELMAQHGAHHLIPPA